VPAVLPPPPPAVLHVHFLSVKLIPVSSFTDREEGAPYGKQHGEMGWVAFSWQLATSNLGKRFFKTRHLLLRLEIILSVFFALATWEKDSLGGQSVPVVAGQFVPLVMN